MGESPATLEDIRDYLELWKTSTGHYSIYVRLNDDDVVCWSKNNLYDEVRRRWHRLIDYMNRGHDLRDIDNEREIGIIIGRPTESSNIEGYVWKEESRRGRPKKEEKYIPPWVPISEKTGKPYI